MQTPQVKAAPGETGRLFSRTPRFFQRQLWVWPLIAAGILLFAGVWVRGRIEGAMRTQIAANLNTIVDANAEALREWAATVKTQVELLAEEGRLVELTGSLLRRIGSAGTSPAAVVQAPEQRQLHALLEPALEARGFAGFVLLDTNLVVVAGANDQWVGVKSPPSAAAQLQVCLEGHPCLTLPFPSLAPLQDEKGILHAGVPTMFVVAPVRSPEDRVIALLGLRIQPERDFTRILATARWGKTGETYAFDHHGVLLSESRFNDELKRLGLIPATAGGRSILALELRDPLQDLRRGPRSAANLSGLPFTRSVADALAGGSGVDAVGYRDYRGVRVVGAWRWLPEFGLGLVSEIEHAEAYAPVGVMRVGFWTLFGLLTAGSALVFFLVRLAGRLQLKAHRATIKAEQLGQYALDEEIGSGGFGTVYRGHHALMRRPVAVKVLDPFADEHSIARFEREVQMTCRLTHPNTIALFDYGRTPNGLFYYAMEYLEGISLDRLIKEHGPQPEGRVIHILRQVCASLREAHEAGLVHRDIKPQNIFLTRRGGIPDFVKVLDFGLVKVRNSAGELELTGAHATLGTPLYMSPEAVQRPQAVDALSDLYSLGAVGYELLTGEPVFSGTTLGEVMIQQVRMSPEKPSLRTRKPVSADLEELIMQCLAKEQRARPASAASLEEALQHCSAAVAWTRQDAETWWRQNLPAAQVA